MSKKIVLGIDPGQDGALAALGRRTLEVHDCPIARRTGTKAAGVHPDEAGMAALVERYAWEGDVVAYIEKVATRRGQGIASSGKFMRNFGTWLGILAAFGIPAIQVSPNLWRPAMVGTGASKAKAREVAAKHFPQSRSLFQRAKDHDRAEAALMALYGAAHQRRMAKERMR